MSNTTYRLRTAAFPQDYAEILIETLGIGDANFLSVKDALTHFRHLDDDQAAEAMGHIAELIRESGNESHEADADVSVKTFEAEGLACLEYLADQADEDCPPESRTRHFIEALEDARDLIARIKAA
jgi:hypothetical protein